MAAGEAKARVLQRAFPPVVAAAVGWRAVGEGVVGWRAGEG